MTIGHHSQAGVLKIKLQHFDYKDEQWSPIRKDEIEGPLRPMMPEVNSVVASKESRQWAPPLNGRQ
jgi:hypothetical protein